MADILCKYLILGNGIAGFRAAKEIRERDADGKILMVSREAYRTYNRPMLTKALCSPLDPEKMAVTDASWYGEHHVEVMLDTKVVGIDAEKNKVSLLGGDTIIYDKLIYTLGADCFLPPFMGCTLPGVFTIRSIEDTVRVKENMQAAKNVVVIGGGVLGLEAAWEISQAGLIVQVVEIAPRIMGKQLDEEGSDFLTGIVKAQGIGICTGRTVAGIEGDSKASGVRLDDGTILPADMVIVSSGVRANISFAKETGIVCNRGIVVDSHMRTNVKNVFAAGDCAEFMGQNNAIWPEASSQGTVAGAAAAGDLSKEYIVKSPAISFRGMGTTLFAVGDNGFSKDETYERIDASEKEKGIYRRFYFKNGLLCGGILVGDTKKMPYLMKSVEGRLPMSEFHL